MLDEDYDIGMDNKIMYGEDIAPDEKNDIIQDLTYVMILKNFGKSMKIEKPINENYQEPLSEVVQPEEVLNFEDYLDEELNQSFIEFNNDIVEEIKQKIIIDLINIWIKPNNTSKDIFAEFNLEVDRLGNVESFVMIRSSGSEAFDRAAIRAINKYKKIAYIKEIDDDTYETYFSNFTIRFKPQ